MKKFLTFWVVALVVLTPIFAQSDNGKRKDDRKAVRAARKEARATERALKRDGFRAYELGAATSSLEKYYLKANAGCTRIVGTSGPCISENLAKITALANAANEYAILQGGNVRGRIVNSASNLSGQQLDNLVTSFERLVDKNIRGELIPYASFYKEKGGQYQFRIYFIVDEDAAARARRQAMERALEEQALAERYGTMAAEWVDEGFRKAIPETE